MSYKKTAQINTSNGDGTFNGFHKNNYSFVFSENIEDWIGSKQRKWQATSTKKTKEQRQAADVAKKEYHRRMPAIGSGVPKPQTV